MTTAESVAGGMWPAFVTLVDALDREGDLDCRFGFQGPCGNNGACDVAALSAAVQQRLPHLTWPVADPSALQSRDVFTLIELFHEWVAFPIWDVCGFCEQSHVVGGDAGVARTKYTTAINAIFRQCHQPLTLEAGKVVDAPTVAPLVARAIGVEQAIEDAHRLTQAQETQQAFDVAFAALHRYVVTACEAAGRVGDADAAVTPHFAWLRQHHPGLRNLGPRQAEVEEVLSALCTALDTLHATGRVEGSHEAGGHLGEAEAGLAINAARAVFVYLDALLSNR